jgi:hypothetical protein
MAADTVASGSLISRESPNKIELKIPSDSTTSRTPETCAASTRFVPLRLGARPSGRAASQVAETAKKHFFGQTGLFLIEVDADALGEALRWEPSRNDELFPHLYGELDLGAVTGVLDMRARSDGYHDLPELLL